VPTLCLPRYTAIPRLVERATYVAARLSGLPDAAVAPSNEIERLPVCSRTRTVRGPTMPSPVPE